MKAFRDLSIITKTRLITAISMIAFILALTLTFGTYWMLGARRTLIQNAEQDGAAAAESIDSLLRTITEDVVAIFGTEDFVLELNNMLSGKEDPIHARIAIQDELMRLATADASILSAIILNSEDSGVYSLFRDAVIPSRSKTLWDSEIRSLSGVSLLPERPSPIRGQGDIIPLAFPMATRFGGIEISLGMSDIIAVALLSADTINSMLPEGGALYNEKGQRITGAEEQTVGRVYSCTIILPFSGLSITVSRDIYAGFLDLLETALASLLAALLISVLIAVFFSRMLRRYVTLPIGKLKDSVKEIENGNYSVKAGFQGNDELGDLRDAISRMATTIENQIEEIKEEEEKQTRTEMRLLSEQLTPHFLYNTLECIQQEIQTGNSKASSEMTRALSLYLRTVLSYGSETITIRNEIQHDMSYIRIMNGRFRKDIIYQHRILPELEAEPILKMVLQPFIENSIKHGFGIGDDSTWIQQPEIETSFTLSGNTIRIEISDNGRGFDENHFLTIMKGGKEGEGHVGIRNTYLRLIKFYGEENVRISVSSLPFYRSTITIDVPRLPK